MIHKFSFIFNRPISPHLVIYSPQFSSLFSIWHRISGVSLASFISLYLIVFKSLTIINYNWLSMLSYLLINLNKTTGFIAYIYLLILLILLYHMLNGLRHIIWDMGLFLSLRALYVSSLLYLIILSILILKFLV